MTAIRVATAIVLDADGRLLVVRKRGTAMFMQPGGKIEPGETPLAALHRELAEEVALTVPAGAAYLGAFEAAAANEPGRTVIAETFAFATTARPRHGGEIEECRWWEAGCAEPLALAPLIVEQVLPRLTAVRAMLADIKKGRAAVATRP